MRGGRWAIVVTELPFQVNKATLMERIADLVHEKKITGISDLRDESDRRGMRIVIELKREAQPNSVVNQLFKHSSLQTTYSINMLALVDQQPRVLSLDMMLRHFLDYRREVVRRRTEFESGAGARARPYPRRAEDRARQSRRGDRHHSSISDAGRGAEEPHGNVLAQRGAGQGDPRDHSWRVWRRSSARRFSTSTRKF